MMPDFHTVNIRKATIIDWPYRNKFTKSRYKRGHMGKLGDILLCETKLHHELVTQNDMKILSVDEIYTILREVNHQIMNSLPLDFVNFINLPYFKAMRDQDIKMVPNSMMT